jgi:hypothetical protein
VIKLNTNEDMNAYSIIPDLNSFRWKDEEKQNIFMNLEVSFGDNETYKVVFGMNLTSEDAYLTDDGIKLFDGKIDHDRWPWPPDRYAFKRAMIHEARKWADMHKY